MSAAKVIRMALPPRQFEQPTTRREFDELILTAGFKLVCIDFTASWCGPCKKIGPVFEALAAEAGDRALFAKVDVDDGDEIAEVAGIRSMPTFQFYKLGEKVAEVQGADEAALRTQLSELLPATAQTKSKKHTCEESVSCEATSADANRTAKKRKREPHVHSDEEGNKVKRERKKEKKSKHKKDKKVKRKHKKEKKSKHR